MENSPAGCDSKCTIPCGRCQSEPAVFLVIEPGHKYTLLCQGCEPSKSGQSPNYKYLLSEMVTAMCRYSRLDVDFVAEVYHRGSRLHTLLLSLYTSPDIRANDMISDSIEGALDFCHATRELVAMMMWPSHRDESVNKKTRVCAWLTEWEYRNHLYNLGVGLYNYARAELEFLIDRFEHHLSANYTGCRSMDQVIAECRRVQPICSCGKPADLVVIGPPPRIRFRCKKCGRDQDQVRCRSLSDITEATRPCDFPNVTAGIMSICAGAHRFERTIRSLRKDIPDLSNRGPSRCVRAGLWLLHALMQVRLMTYEEADLPSLLNAMVRGWMADRVLRAKVYDALRVIYQQTNDYFSEVLGFSLLTYLEKEKEK